MMHKIKYFIGKRVGMLQDYYQQALCYEGARAAKNTFMKGASVSNFQNDPDKISIGEGTAVRGELLVFANGGKITIGKNAYVGEHSRIWSAEEIVIGNNVLISHNVNICDTNSHEIDHELRAAGYQNMLKYGHPKEKSEIKTKAIRIGDDAWIGFNSIILKGVTIGRAAIISAGSVVNQDVAPFCIVSGNPAVVVKYLDQKAKEH